MDFEPYIMKHHPHFVTLGRDFPKILIISFFLCYMSLKNYSIHFFYNLGALFIGGWVMYSFVFDFCTTCQIGKLHGNTVWGIVKWGYCYLKKNGWHLFWKWVVVKIDRTLLCSFCRLIPIKLLLNNCVPKLLNCVHNCVQMSPRVGLGFWCCSSRTNLL